jgi:RimJ/RimL family protein N-acetyltransferase
VTPGGLVLRPVGSDDELLAVLERVADGTLDAHTRRDVAASGVAAAARTQLEDMAWMPAPRGWWRLAWAPDGTPAGVVLPSRNHQAAVIGYVGVVPEQRGRGHAADLVSWATAFLAAEGADRVVADTDTGNAPMAAAFARAGYAVTAHRVVMA